VRRSRLVLALVTFAVTASACGGGDAPPLTSGTSSGVDPERAATAIEALCEIEAASDLEPARAAFYDRAHATLHEVASAAAAADPGSDAELLIAKQRVEAALEESGLPPGFDADVARLRVAATVALDALGISPPGCER
jgi:hypothetical protein